MPRTTSRARFWAKAFQQWQQSGLSKAEFCRQNGLVLSSLKNWLYNAEYRAQIDQVLVSEPSRREASPPRFIPMTLVAERSTAASSPAPSSRPQPTLEVVLGSGRRIAVATGFD